MENFDAFYKKASELGLNREQADQVAEQGIKLAVAALQEEVEVADFHKGASAQGCTAEQIDSVMLHNLDKVAGSMPAGLRAYFERKKAMKGMKNTDSEMHMPSAQMKELPPLSETKPMAMPAQEMPKMASEKPTMNQNFHQGFTKRAAEYGLNQKQANDMMAQLQAALSSAGQGVNNFSSAHPEAAGAIGGGLGGAGLGALMGGGKGALMGGAAGAGLGLGAGAMGKENKAQDILAARDAVAKGPAGTPLGGPQDAMAENPMMALLRHLTGQSAPGTIPPEPPATLQPQVPDR